MEKQHKDMKGKIAGIIRPIKGQEKAFKKQGEAEVVHYDENDNPPTGNITQREL